MAEADIPNTKTAKKLKRKLKKACLYTTLSCLLIFSACWWVIPHFFTIPELQSATPEQSRIILDRNGEELYHATREDFVRNRHSNLQDIPESFIQATLAAEDKRFWEHGGIDFFATARAAKDALSSGRFVSGASTISQQTVKLTNNLKDRTLKTKIIEAFKARKLEMNYSKRDILTLYFNTIDYGNRTQGPQQAARHYFNKSLGQLSLAEAALLAGLPQAPTRHNPRKNPESALKRRNWILDRMADVYAIDSEQIERAKNEPLQLWSAEAYSKHPELAKLNESSNTSTFKTTLSKPLFEEVKAITQRELEKIQKQNVNNAAVVVIHNPTGEILCLLGSPDFHSPLGGQYNAALIPHSPGSALKPFNYLLAFEKRGLTPASIIPDVPTFYAGERGAEEFVNYDRKHHGPVTISKALGNSLNIPAVRVLNLAGGPTKLHQFLQSFGITSLSENPQDYGLTLSIGGGEVTLLELTNAYATIARLGHFFPSTIRFDDHARFSQGKRVASEEQCYLLAQIMSNNHARSLTFGTRSHLRLPFPCAVKTGTSTDYKDNFCVGFTKEYTVGVWVGNIDNSPMQGISGVTGAGPIFNQTMLALHRNTTPTWFKRPSEVQSYTVDPHTGKLLESSHPRYYLAEQVELATSPEQAEEGDYTENFKPYLNQRYTKWIRSHRDRFALPPQEIYSAPKELLSIYSPTQGATYLLDPDLPQQGKFLKLSANLENITWSCSTLPIKDGVLELQEGTHLISAKIKDSDKPEDLEEIEIHVKAL